MQLPLISCRAGYLQHIREKSAQQRAIIFVYDSYLSPLLLNRRRRRRRVSFYMRGPSSRLLHICVYVVNVTCFKYTYRMGHSRNFIVDCTSFRPWWRCIIYNVGYLLHLNNDYMLMCNEMCSFRWPCCIV